MIALAFIFDLHEVAVLGRDKDVYFTFSTDPDGWEVEVVWFRHTGHLVPFNQYGGWRI